MKLKNLKPRKPIATTGWKPKVKWLIVLRRMGPDGKTIRMFRGCKDLADGREIAKSYLDRGWESAWVQEAPAGTPTAR